MQTLQPNILLYNHHNAHKNVPHCCLTYSIWSVLLFHSVLFITHCPNTGVNNRRSRGLESVFFSFLNHHSKWGDGIIPTAPLLLLGCTLWFHSFPTVHRSLLGSHLWKTGEDRSWHSSAPPTVHGSFTQNPAHSLKVQSINTVWCWNIETLKRLAVFAQWFIALGDIAFTPAIIYGLVESCTYVLFLSLTYRSITLQTEITPNNYSACYYTGIILTGKSWAAKAIEL